MENSFIALGLMSGTSLDGIDASVIKSDGEENLDIIDNIYLSYPMNLKKDFLNKDGCKIYKIIYLLSIYEKRFMFKGCNSSISNFRDNAYLK